MEKAILVTGASSGIGLATVKYCASHFVVYAGARKEADLASLGKFENIAEWKMYSPSKITLRISKNGESYLDRQ